MTSTVQSIILGNEVTLEYAEQGDKTGIPVICLHGVTDSFHSFDPVLPHLPASYHVFAISQRGHGHSSRPLTGYRYADFADDVHRFMTALRLPSAVIVGHSMGSLVAQRFAIDHPSRTLGVVLAGSFLTIHGEASVQEFWETTISQLTDPVDRAVALDFQMSTLARPVPPAFLDLVVEESLKVPAHVWRATFSEFLATDFSHELRRIHAPVLMISGDQDAYAGEAHRAGLRQAIPHAQVKLYEQYGHAMHWEAPQRFARDIVSFVQEHCLHHAL
jgi:non-heme chloroperoxidase